MEFNRCLRCMEEVRGYPCPHCGYDPGMAKTADYGLRPGAILNGKYVVGAILGQGGFGITYVGWDLALDCKVAIKEYYPSGQVVRDNATGSVLHWLSTPQSEAARNMGKEMFLKEARKMTRVRNVPQVVHVHDLFQENDTAYIVMDFVEGQTLKAHLAKNGPLSWEQAKDIFLPTIRSMEQVHQAGLVHRDLSPDNLMIAPDGRVQILDLGAAKDLNINSGASSMQVAKGGFSPLEQYSQRGGSGPWTDVYAMAATMYYCLTGVLPPASVDRVDEDPIRWDLEPLKALPKPALEALKKAMVLLAKDRTQTMGEFLRQLEKAQNQRKPKKKKLPLPAIAAVLVVALVARCVLWPKQEAKPQLNKLEVTSPLSVQEQTISASSRHTIAIKKNGNVIAAGDNTFDQCDIWDRTNIVSVSAGTHHTIGLKSDGTLVSTGSNDYDQCNVSRWTDIKAICTGASHTVGLKTDGTVVAAGTSLQGQCRVSDWTDIVAISANGNITVGLKADATVLATGSNTSGQCNVSTWKQIIAISAGYYHTIGLKANGHVVATGSNDIGQCNVSDWEDIVAISAGTSHTVGLKADGTVVATGNNTYGQCDVSNWTDIVAITAGGFHTVGLKADGTLVATGYNIDGQCNVSYWTDIRIPGTIS